MSSSYVRSQDPVSRCDGFCRNGFSVPSSVRAAAAGLDLLADVDDSTRVLGDAVDSEYVQL